MLWLICFFNYADRQAIFSVFKSLETEFGFDKEQLGMIGAAFTLVYALSAPFAGQTADRLSRKLVIIGGLYIWSAVTGFTSVCSKLWHFILVRGAEGLGETFYFPASMSMISDYHGKSTRSRAMSLHQTAVYAGTIGGGAFAGIMAQNYGWRSPFVILALAGIILGIALAIFIREPKRNEAERAEENSVASVAEPIPMRRFLIEWIKTPSAVLLMLAFFGANLVALLFLTWAPMFLLEKFRLTLAQAGLGGTFFIQTGSMIGAVAGGVMADKLRQTFAGGRMITQAVGALLGAPFIFIFGVTTDMTILIVAMFLFGVFKGLYDANIWASLFDVIPPSRRAAAVGVMNMAGWLGGALGAYSLGALVERKVMTMSVAFASTAGIYLFIAILLTLASFFARLDVNNAKS